MDFTALPWWMWAMLILALILTIAHIIRNRRNICTFGCDPEKGKRGPGGAMHIGTEKDVFDHMFRLSDQLTKEEKKKLLHDTCPKCGNTSLSMYDTKGGRAETFKGQTSHVEHWWKTYGCPYCDYKGVLYWGCESSGPLSQEEVIS